MAFKSLIIYSAILTLTMQTASAENPFTRTLQWIQERMIRPELGARHELIAYVSRHSTEAREIYTSLANHEILKDAVLVRTSVGADRALKQAVFISGAENGAAGFRVHVASVGEFKYARYVADINVELYNFWIRHSLSSQDPLRRALPQLVQVATRVSPVKGVPMNVVTYKLKDLELFEIDATDLKQILRIIADIPALDKDFVRVF